MFAEGGIRRGRTGALVGQAAAVSPAQGHFPEYRACARLDLPAVPSCCEAFAARGVVVACSGLASRHCKPALKTAGARTVLSEH